MNMYNKNHIHIIESHCEVQSILIENIHRNSKSSTTV